MGHLIISKNMYDPGFVYGFIGVGIDKVIQHILHCINIAVRCKKELASLKDLLMKIEPNIKQIHKYRWEINKKKKYKVSSISEWFKDLDSLLQEAS
jgi:hypothetical protein